MPIAYSKTHDFQNEKDFENEYNKELREKILSVYKTHGMKKGSVLTRTHFLLSIFKDKETGLNECLNDELEKMVRDGILEFIPPNDYRLLVSI